jgi:hypothetical protein
MSDTPQGPGWWQASDGRWYAPELHPDAQPAHPVEAAAAPVVPQGPSTAPPPDLPPVAGPPEPVWEAPPPAAWEPPPPVPVAPAASSRAWIPRAIIVVDLAIVIILLALLLLRD